MSPLCHNRDRPLQALDHGAMVEMGTIREEQFTGLPLLLGAGSLPRLSRRQSIGTAKRKSPRPTAVIIPSPGNAQSSGDAVDFGALTRHLRPVRRLAANLMFEVAITEYRRRAMHNSTSSTPPG